MKKLLAILTYIFTILFFAGAFAESALACAICEFFAMIFAAAAAIVYALLPSERWGSAYYEEKLK